MVYEGATFGHADGEERGVVPERNVDCGALYESTRRDFLRLLGSLDASELTATVPATPAWCVRDVLCHVVGVTADLNAQNFGTGDADLWTATQVSNRRDRSIGELAAEWDEEAPRFEEGMRLLGYEIGSHYIGDLLHHVADVRHALDLPRPADDEALAVALDFYLVAFEQALAQRGIGAVEVRVASERWVLGVGAVVASVTAERYELFRSLGGRRNEAQVRALHWEGDIEAVLPVVSQYPMPSAPIVD
jgi:uncharacterized protein (TIGR03083 family)